MNKKLNAMRYWINKALVELPVKWVLILTVWKVFKNFQTKNDAESVSRKGLQIASIDPIDPIEYIGTPIDTLQSSV